ncbi:MAG: TIR domain-containing protein [Bacteroidia bacterium]
MIIPRHKVFLSFHHGDPLTDPYCGQKYKERFEYLFSSQYEAMITKSVQDGDIKDGITTETTRQKIRDEYIADATVTIVLIGPETWKRKHVDWEISSSIRDTSKNSRCGLIGILLPNYPDYDRNANTFNQYTIPPRLWDNKVCGFANIYVWNENPTIVQGWIHDAFLRRNKILPDNSYPLFNNNRSVEQTRWSY